MVQLHSPEFGSVVHDAPVSVQDPLEGLVPCGAVDSCTTDPNADAPVNVRVWLEVMLSVVEMPESDESMRFGSDVAGNAYRTMTSPDPPVPPALEDATAPPPPPPPFPLFEVPEAPVELTPAAAPEPPAP